MCIPTRVTSDLKILQNSVKEDPRFIGKVKEFLSAGLSDSPKNIF